MHRWMFVGGGCRQGGVSSLPQLHALLSASSTEARGPSGENQELFNYLKNVGQGVITNTFLQFFR